MYEAAKGELERLMLTDRGQNDERVYTALAKVNYKLHFITEALSYLRKARQLSKNSKARESLSALYEQWLSAYGLVRFEPIDQVSRGTVELQRTRKLINKQRQAAYKKTQELLSQPVNLPLSLYLPYGAYIANGVHFKVERNRSAPIVDLMLTPATTPVKKEHEYTKIPWVYVGIGAVTILGAGLSVYFLSQEDPAPNQQLTITISDGL